MRTSAGRASCRDVSIRSAGTVRSISTAFTSTKRLTARRLHPAMPISTSITSEVERKTLHARRMVRN
jgi:hypothetical protein